MPIKQAAYKAHRQNLKAHTRNLGVKTDLKKTAVHLRKALAAKNLEEAKKLTTTLMKALDKAAQKKVIHRNTASRKKSRLMSALRKAAA